MAHSAHKTKAEYKEHFDTEDVLQQKVATLAKWVVESNHFIAFTGAGISTSAGIPDFRSGANTVLPTGAGVWTARAILKKDPNAKLKKPKKKTKTTKAIPTPTHMALVALQKANHLKWLISQNTDGLHRRSGFPAQCLSELHGNSNKEICTKCGKEYLRDFRTRTAKRTHSHLTGRRCTVVSCGGPLKDSIINFGENLPERALSDGESHSQKADLCLAMGSSLRVTPAADLPEAVARRGKRLVIVNLQSTPLDKLAALRINATTDKVMSMLMAQLGIAIPAFVLRRWVSVKSRVVGKPTSSNSEVATSRVLVELAGVDADGTPYTLFKAVNAKLRSDCVKVGKASMKRLASDPYRFAKTLSDNKLVDLLESKENSSPDAVNKVEFSLTFQGHYNEPELKLDLPIRDVCFHGTFHLAYHPKTGKFDEPVLKAAE